MTEYVDRRGDIAEQVLAKLAHGPVQSFGSYREVDRVLTSLKKKGKIRFRSKKNGGEGWELVK